MLVPKMAESLGTTGFLPGTSLELTVELVELVELTL